MSAPAIRATQQIARPLKVLIPLIQGKLQQGNVAGREHYTEAGRLLNEARPQKSRGQWSQWVSENFDLSLRTAQAYMQWAREVDTRNGVSPYASLRQMTGATERRREHYNSPQQKKYRDVLREVAADTFVQERQARDAEIDLHRELAGELIDIGSIMAPMPFSSGPQSRISRASFARALWIPHHSSGV